MKNLLLITLLFSASVASAQSITPAQAKKSVGKAVTVCGQVTSAQFTEQIDGHPTYLGFGTPFPNQIFSIVILEENLGKFAYNPADLKDSKVCVTGKVEMYLGKPAILVTDPNQIEEQDQQ